MSVQTNRLGKGLDALIPNIIPNTSLSITQIPVETIQPNPYQPRQYFNPDALNELAHSIKTHGLAQPIIVRELGDGYELIVGERRLEATKLIGQMTIPAIIKTISDKIMSPLVPTFISPVRSNSSLLQIFLSPIKKFKFFPLFVQEAPISGLSF